MYSAHNIQRDFITEEEFSHENHSIMSSTILENGSDFFNTSPNFSVQVEKVHPSLRVLRFKIQFFKSVIS